MDIAKTILSDPINRWLLSNTKTEIFFVGGYVRDLLRNHISNDRDLVLKSAVEDIAIETAKKFNGTFIVLKPRKTFRVVLRNKEALDFSFLKGSIKNDLKERDFTINAIAWSRETGIIDPFKGREDIKKHIVKAVRIKNLTDDPLRIIRAYRIAAELGFKIEGRTRKSLKRYSKRLVKMAPERLTEELFKILSNESALPYLVECCKDRVLEKILDPMRFIKNIDNFSKKIKFLKGFESFLKTHSVTINKLLKGHGNFFREEISQGLNKRGLIRLALLLNSADISHTCLGVSKNIRKALRDIHNGYTTAMLMWHADRYTGAQPQVSERRILCEELYKIFNASGKRVFETAIILSFIKRKNIKEFFKKVNEYMRIKNKILLNGNEIQKILNMKPGVKIGDILSVLQAEQFKGLIKTREQAMKWLLGNFT